MSTCSSISCDSGSLIDDELFGRNRNTVGKNIPYPFSPAKASRMNIPTRSRPGIQRSDHTSASVQQLEFDDISCASFYSSTSSATTASITISKQYQLLSRKESISPLKRSVQGSGLGSCLDLSTNVSIGCDTSSALTSPTRSSSSNNSRIKTVQFAPLSENLYIPIPSIDEMTEEEIEGTWFTTKDYERHRTSCQNILALMEQELQHQQQKLSPSTEGTKGEAMSSTFISIVKSIEEARGLEHRTKEGTQAIFRNRQQSIQAVLKEQKRLKIMYGSDENNVWKQTSGIATTYSMGTLMPLMDAIERAMYDAKVAAGVEFETISPKSCDKNTTSSILLDRRFVSESSTADCPPSNITSSRRIVSSSSALLNNQYDSINDSLHTLSSSTKRGYKPRPMPQRTPSSSLSTIPLGTHSQRNTPNRNVSYQVESAPPLTSQQQLREHSFNTPNASRMLSLDANSALRRSTHHAAYMKESLLLNTPSTSSHSKNTRTIRPSSNDIKGSNNGKGYSSRHIVV